MGNAHAFSLLSAAYLEKSLRILMSMLKGVALALILYLVEVDAERQAHTILFSVYL